MPAARATFLPSGHASDRNDTADWDDVAGSGVGHGRGSHHDRLRDVRSGGGKGQGLRRLSRRQRHQHLALFPHLAGQPAIYLAKQLQAFRSGKRRNEMMDIIARDLSDEDIRILSEYFETLPACAGQP